MKNQNKDYYYGQLPPILEYPRPPIITEYDENFNIIKQKENVENTKKPLKEQKLCPLHGFTPCLENQCGIWDIKINQCGFISIKIIQPPK